VVFHYIMLIVLVLNMSCSQLVEFPRYMDRRVFERWGVTFFTQPEVISMKEIHLESTTLIGREVLVEGVVDHVGKYATHLVVSDGLARLLVVVTGVNTDALLRAGVDGQNLKIWGFVENGRKGLPYLQALAIRRVDNKANNNQKLSL
jgi:hypothetical protein